MPAYFYTTWKANDSDGTLMTRTERMISAFL